MAGAVLSADAPEVEFSGLDAAVANVRLSLDSNTESRIGIYVKDEGNSQWYSMPSAVAVGAGEGDYYARLHLAGRMTAVKFALLDGEDAEICFDGLDFNVAQPFAVSWKRLIVFAAAFAFVFAFRPRSSAYCIPFSSCKKLVIAFACLQVGAVLVLGVVSPYGRAVQNLDNHRQYYDLAVSLSKGQVFLDEEPSSQLMGMDNPYDRQARDAEGVSYHWDRAYYEGKYYVYFGVMPALVFHLPYYLVTGGAFPNWIGVVLCCAAFVAGLAKLLWEMCARWFRLASFGTFVLADFVLVSGSWILYANYYQDLYCLPISLGLACLVWGLSFWVKATASLNGPDVKRAVMGSALVALTLLCRPQLFAGAAFGILLVVPYLRSAKRKRRAAGLKGIAVALVPFAVVFLLAGWYNVARFGSPLDFGANYNLTTNDMTQRGFVLDRIPLAVFSYVFQLPLVSLSFPFLNAVPVYANTYMGITIFSTMHGGILALSPLLVWSLALPCLAGRLRGKGAFGFSLLSLVLAAVLVIFDAEAAGVLPRYFCDFGIFFALPAAMAFLACLETYRATSVAAFDARAGVAFESDGGRFMLADVLPATCRATSLTGALQRASLRVTLAVVVLTCAIMASWILVQPTGP